MSNSIKTKQELINAITQNYSLIKEYGVKQIGFFGSFKRDEANELSDVDFFIDFYPEFKTLKNFLCRSDNKPFLTATPWARCCISGSAAVKWRK